jgi:hypothetical protein
MVEKRSFDSLQTWQLFLEDSGDEEAEAGAQADGERHDCGTANDPAFRT